MFRIQCLSVGRFSLYVLPWMHPLRLYDTLDSLFGSYIRNMGLVVYMYSVLSDFNNISIVFDLFDLCKFV